MKVYEKIIVGWNEETEQYDRVIYEDSFDYYGTLDLAMPDPTAQMSITVGSLDYETVPPPVTNEYEWPTQYVEESSPGGLNRLLFSGAFEGGITCSGAQIGDQCWMAENLTVTHYRNGDPIHPNGLDEPAADDVWISTTEGAYGEHSDQDINIFGRLYNWYAVEDSRGICPEGWRVPTDDEIKELEVYLGMCEFGDDCADDTGQRGTNEGSKLAGNSDLWYEGDLENNPEFGTSGFDFLPGGWRNSTNGGYANTLGLDGFGAGYFWSSTVVEDDVARAWQRQLYYGNAFVGRFNNPKEMGASVRCVTDINPIIPSIPGEYWACDHLRLYNADGWSDPLSESCTEDVTDFGTSEFTGNHGIYANCDELADDAEPIDVWLNRNSTPWAQFGNQCWMLKNLAATHYRNGDPIHPDGLDEPASNDAWNGTEGAYVIYPADWEAPDGHIQTCEGDCAAVYGLLYNWYAVVDPRGACPEGWHVPTDEEWMELEIYFGMCEYGEDCADDTSFRGTNEGSKLAGNEYLWTSGGHPIYTGSLLHYDEFGTSGFDFLPAGYIFPSGVNFGGMGDMGYLWSSTESEENNDEAWRRLIHVDDGRIVREDTEKDYGFSARCIADDSTCPSSFPTDWLYTTGDEACASLNTPNPENIPTLQGIHTANQYCREVLDESSFPDLAQSEAIAYSDGYCTPESMTVVGPEFCAMFGGVWTHGDYVVEIPEDLTYNSYQYTFYEGENPNLYIQHFPSFSNGRYDQVNGFCLRTFSSFVSQTSYLAENIFAPLLEYSSFRYVTTETASDGVLGFYSGTVPGSEEPPGVVQIGDQCWMDKNLDVTEYNNGDQIPTGYSNSEWPGLSTGAYAIYDDDPANSVIYGNLYNGYVVEDPRGICPEGFHVPSEEEWVILEDYISSDSGGQYSGYEGVALKDEGYRLEDGYWNNTGDPSEEGLDVYGWTGLPAGERSFTGPYNYGPGWGTQANFWSSTELGAMTWQMSLSHTTTTMYQNWSSKLNGYSVRCISDFPACPQVSILQTVTPGLGYTVAMEVPFEECGPISGDESYALYEGELLDLSSGVDLLYEGSSTTNVYKMCDNIERISYWEDQGLFDEGQPYENIVKIERIPKTTLVYEPCHGCGDVEYQYICGYGSASDSDINFSEYVLAEHPDWDIIGPCGDEFLHSYTFDIRSMWPLDFDNEIHVHEWPLMDGQLLLSGEHDPWWAAGGVNTFPVSPGGIHTAFQYCKENHGDNYIAVIHLTGVGHSPPGNALSHVSIYDSPEQFSDEWGGEQYDLSYYTYWYLQIENSGWQNTGGIELITPYFWRQITCAPYGLPRKANATGFGGELDRLQNGTYAITVDNADTFGFDWNMCSQGVPTYLNPTEWLTGNLYEGDIYIWKSLTCSSTGDQPDYEPITIELDNTSYSNPGSVGIATSHWEFGDGNVYTCDGVCSPPLDIPGGVYEYETGFWGQTTVCLIVTDLNGDVNSVCRVISLDNPYINDPPVTHLEVS